MSETAAVDVFLGLHPIFRECAGESAKYAIDIPFLQDGWLYATDGRIQARLAKLRRHGAILYLPVDRLDLSPSRFHLRDNVVGLVMPLNRKNVEAEGRAPAEIGGDRA